MLGANSHYVIAILSLITGAFFGSIDVFGSIEIENKINVMSILSLGATLLIAFLIPTTVKKVLDDNKSVKILLVDEVQDLVILTKLAYSKINEFYTSNTQMTGGNKDFVIEAFYNAELKMDSIREQFKVSYPEKEAVHQDIMQALLNYKSFVTGGVFMNSIYIEIDYDFFMQNKNEFSNFEKNVMTKIHCIHKF